MSPRLHRFRIATALTLIVLGLPRATAQILSAPFSAISQPDLPPTTATPDPGAVGGPFSPPLSASPDATGALDSTGVADPSAGLSGSQGPSRSRSPMPLTPGATPRAFGSVRDFSRELGIQELFGPNSPSLQPLSVSDYRLVLPPRNGVEPRRHTFILSGTAGGRGTAYSSRFALNLSQAGQNPDRDSPVLNRGATLAWPAIQQL